MQTSLVKSILRWRWSLLVAVVCLSYYCSNWAGWPWNANRWKSGKFERCARWKIKWQHFIIKPIHIKRENARHRQSSVPTSSVGQHALLWWAPSPGSLPLLCLTCVCVRACMCEYPGPASSKRASTVPANSHSPSHTQTDMQALCFFPPWLCGFLATANGGVPFGIPDAELHADWPIGSSLMKMRVMIFFYPFP